MADKIECKWTQDNACRENQSWHHIWNAGLEFTITTQEGDFGVTVESCIASGNVW